MLETETFRWGVANSAFQVEGFPAPSDWLEWTRTPGRILDGTKADRATEFWKRYPEDIALAKRLGVNAFRLSLAWERIEPRAGEFDAAAIAHYRAIIREIIDAGMEPWITLHHFVLPAWLAEKGGLLAPEFPEHFAAFAAYAFRELSAGVSVRNWMTFNEPNVLVRSSYLEGEWPPGRKGKFDEAARASFHLAKAHVLAVNRIRLSLSESENAAVRFGIAAHWRAFQPKRLRWLDQLATRLTDWVFNRQILDSAATGRIRSWFPGSPFLRERIRFAGPWKGLDFLGVNYYGRTVMSFSPKPPFVLAEEGTDGEKNDMGWEIYPSGLRDVLHETYRRYRVPVAVTENGLADRDDSRRGSFLTGHLEALAQARREGVPVEGYFHWSLTDNFEWAHGEAPRFGLVEVDYTTLERRPRPSFEVYRKFIADFGRGGPAPRGERA